MSPLHIFISIWNLICGFAFILLISTSGNTAFREAISLIVVSGYFANILAVIVTFVLFVSYLIRLAKGSSEQFIKNEWLGFFNGMFVVFCWAAFIGYSYYATPTQ